VIIDSWYRALYSSRNGGADWTCDNRGITTNNQADESRFGAPHFEAIAVSPGGANDRSIYLGGFDGLFHTHNLETGWQAIETLPLGTVLGVDVAGDDRESAVLAAIYGSGFYLLRDGALPWRARTCGLETMRLGAVAFSPNYDDDRSVFGACEGKVLKLSTGMDQWMPAPLLPSRGKAQYSTRLSSMLRGVEKRLSNHLGQDALQRLYSVYRRLMTHIQPCAVRLSIRSPLSTGLGERSRRLDLL